MELAFPIIEVVFIFQSDVYVPTNVLFVCKTNDDYGTLDLMQEEWCVCWVFKKKFENWKKEQGRRRNMIFFCQLFCTWLIFIASPYPLLNDHATFHDLNIILRNKETYFVDIFFLFWYIFWTCGIGMLFFISLEFVMGGEDQVRKKWHCCIYNITTIWIQIFHTSNSILGTLRFQKGVHNLTRIFLKKKVVFTYYY